MANEILLLMFPDASEKSQPKKTLAACPGSVISQRLDAGKPDDFSFLQNIQFGHCYLNLLLVFSAQLNISCPVKVLFALNLTMQSLIFMRSTLLLFVSYFLPFNRYFLPNRILCTNMTSSDRLCASVLYFVHLHTQLLLVLVPNKP